MSGYEDRWRAYEPPRKMENSLSLLELFGGMLLALLAPLVATLLIFDSWSAYESRFQRFAVIAVTMLMAASWSSLTSVLIGSDFWMASRLDTGLVWQLVNSSIIYTIACFIRAWQCLHWEEVEEDGFGAS